jgi:hypothetical protein
MRLIGLAVVLALGFALAPPAVEAQQARKSSHTIGVISPIAPEKSRCLPALRRGLNSLGYREGETYVLAVRWSETGSFPTG